VNLSEYSGWDPRCECIWVTSGTTPSRARVPGAITLIPTPSRADFKDLQGESDYKALFY
jgi:hypothetical protein